MQPEPVLDVCDVTVGFADHTVLDGVDLQALPGQVTVLLGPNGAGKTTLIRCCTGLMAPAAGRIVVCGTSPTAACAQGRVGLMPQATGAWSGITAAELLAHLAGLHRRPLDLSGLITEMGLTSHLGTPYRRLSGGQQQAVNLLGAIVGRPQLVFLDEPTAGMDPRARRTTWDLITRLAEAGVAVLLTTHDMAEAETLASTIAILGQGRIRAQGNLAELTGEQNSLEDVFLAATAEEVS